MEENLYAVIFDFRDGGNQYEETRVVKAGDKDEARERVHKYLENYFGEDTEVDRSFVGGERGEETKTYTAPKGYPAVKVYGIAKVETLEELARKIGYIPEE